MEAVPCQREGQHSFGHHYLAKSLVNVTAAAADLLATLMLLKKLN